MDRLKVTYLVEFFKAILNEIANSVINYLSLFRKEYRELSNPFNRVSKKISIYIINLKEIESINWNKMSLTFWKKKYQIII